MMNYNLSEKSPLSFSYENDISPCVFKGSFYAITDAGFMIISQRVVHS